MEEKYIETLHINGYDINLGIDDYGQCYFIEWEEDGQKKDLGLGTYNFRYLEEIYYLFDPVYKILAIKDLKGEEMTPEEKKEWQQYKDSFDEEYKLLEED